MKNQTELPKPIRPVHERLSEIGLLLAQAICRLKLREVKENGGNPIDFIALPTRSGGQR